MRAVFMTVGAFLLTIGVTLIVAIPDYIRGFILSAGLGFSDLNSASELGGVVIVLTSIGAALLAYGISATPKEANPMAPQ